MTSPPLSSHYIRAVVEAVLEKDESARTIGIHATGAWKNGDSLEVKGRRFRVVSAPGALDLRAALLQAETEKDPVVILSGLSNLEVGADARARLARGRVFTVTPWDTLRALFHASRLDTSGLPLPLARALIEAAPKEGFPPVPAGILDSGTAWRTYFEQVLGMPSGGIDLASLIVWGSAPEGVRRFRILAADPELFPAARARIRDVLGEAGETVIDAMVSETGASPMSLAVACGVIFAREAVRDPSHERAAGRLERFHGDRPLSAAVGVKLARAAEAAFHEIEERRDVDLLHRQLEGADEILARLGIEHLSHLSSISPRGYKERLARFAGAVLEALETLKTSPDAADEVLRASETRAKEVGEHRLSERAAEQGGRVILAVRLLRWIASEDREPESFSDEVERYVLDTSFADRAREAISGGDDDPAVTRAYQALDRAASERRRRIDERFARSLQGWLETGSSAGRALPVEEVLSQLVAPLIKAGYRILLVVVDGMSWAVVREILEDERALRFGMTCRLKGEESPIALVATAPSMTEFSRASLLSGELMQGHSQDEKREFASNATLTALCERNPPVLYHKGELTESPRGPLADRVRKEIVSRDRKLVGVVVNAVDDRLANAQQKRERWTIDGIRPLGSLLEAAWEGERVVILVSDHGHVLHRDGDNTEFPGASERSRPAVGEVRKGEILLKGQRVFGLGGAKAVIVPWDEAMRYRAHKNGYHGGATPEEMLAPLLILAERGKEYAGLEPVETPLPAWWQESLRRPVTEAKPKVEATAERVPISREFADLDIFVAATKPSREKASDVRPLAQEDFIDRLFRTAAYRAQAELVRKHAPKAEEIMRCLRALEAEGGSLTRLALAQKVEVDLVRLDGFLAKVQRVLNIDGYEVIRNDRERDVVELNRELLLRQFEVD